MSALVDDLRARLRGPAGVRRGLLREVEDGLRDAAEAYERAGLPPAEAARRAADEFGDPAELAPLYQAELDASRGRRAALLIALAYPTLTLAWDALWRYTSVGDGAAPDGVATVARVLDTGSYGAAVVAAVTIPLYGRASAAMARRLTIGVGLLGWLSLALILAMSIWMAQASGDHAVREFGSNVPSMLVVGLTVSASLAIASTATLALSRWWVPRAAR